MGVLAGVAHGDYVWSEAQQITHLTTTLGGYHKGNLLPGRSDSLAYHLLVRQCEADTSCNGMFATAFYMNVNAGSPLDWQEAWDTREVIVGPDGFLNCNDLRFAIDRNDDVHVVHEMFNHPDSGVVRIGYKRRSGSNWISDGTPAGLPSIVSESAAPDVSGREVSPRLLLIPDGADERLHLTYNANRDPHGTGGTGWTVYTTKLDTASVWAPEAYLTDRISGGMFTDDTGLLHLVGKERFKAMNPLLSPDTAQVVHLAGPIPAPGSFWSITEQDILASYLETRRTLPPEAEESPPEDDPVVEVASDGYVYVMYSSPNDSTYLNPPSPWDPADGEAYLRRYDPGATGSARWYPDTNSVGVRTTPPDTVWSKGLSITPTPQGIFHVLYTEPAPPQAIAPSPPGGTAIWHFMATDPTDPATWTTPTDLSFDREWAVRQAGIVADSTAVQVTYSSWVTDPWSSLSLQVYERTGDAAYTITPGAPETWMGTVSLDRDVRVLPGGVLTISDGATVVAESYTDRANTGRYPHRVEIVVDGQLLVNGLQSSPVTLTSTDQISGDWGGILFRNAENDTTVSSIRHAEIEYPVIGVQVDSLSCELFRNEFVGTEDGDIYVDRDTRLPAGYQWVLTGGTDVKIESGVDNSTDDGGEVPTLSEIQIDGALRTVGTSAAGDSVTFTPTVPGDNLSDDWYGIVVRGSGFNDGKGVIQMNYAEISHARYPLSLFLADTASVKRSWVHNYNQEGITDWASDAVIEDCDVQRGPDASIFETDSVGRVGIHLVSTFGQVRDNRVFQHWERGIWADYSSTFCKTPTSPQSVDVLTIEDNAVIADEGLNTAARGIEVSFACKYQHVEVLGNNVQGWLGEEGGGITIWQSSDVVVDCNCLQDNRNGILHRRDHYALETDADDGYSRAHDNYLVRNRHAGIRAWKAGPDTLTGGPRTAGIELGTGGSDLGGNVLRPLSNQTRNYRLNAFEWNRTDLAIGNAWRDDQGDSLDAEATIATWNEYTADPLEQTILVSNWISSSSYFPSCVAGAGQDTCPTIVGPSGAAFRPPRRIEAPGPAARTAETPVSVASSDGLPLRFALHDPVPNPAGSSVALRFDVPHAAGDGASIRVYDVAGRLVRRLAEGPIDPGRHVLRWDLRGSGSAPVASGIYFVRMTAGDFRATRRVMVLR